MSTSWKYKSWVFLIGILYAIYLLVPTVFGFKDLKAEAKKQEMKLPWHLHLFSQKELNLGLDLRGGMYLELEVGLEEALQHQLDFLAGDIQRLVLADKFTHAGVVQIPGLKLRAEVGAPDSGKFKSEVVRAFSNDTFTITREPQELLYQIGSDAEQARKKIYEKLKNLAGVVAEVSVFQDQKIAAVSYNSRRDRDQISALLSDESLKPDIVEVTGSYQDVLYLLPTETHLGYLRRNIIEQATQSVRNRVDRFGVAEAAVSQESSDRLVLELPGVKDPDRIIDIIKRTGKLEFRLVDEGISRSALQDMIHAKKEELKIEREYDEASLKKLDDALKADLPAGAEIAFQLNRDPETKKITGAIPYLLEKSAPVTGDMLENSSVQTQNNLPYVAMSFNKVGAKKFGDLTAQNVGRYLAIVLDGVVTSAPVIKSPILGGQASIELGFGRYQDLQRDAQELVLILKEGALPASLKVGTKNIIGPSLGKDSIDAGLKSLFIGALAVLVFMLVYYKVGGLVANIALVVNGLLIFAVLTLFQASLTLPGIAGIVLTMGMAVDANVIIFERMREEMHLSTSMNAVVANGYGHAMSAIIDSNITTFISGLVLFEFGTGPIKGFATTLMIGIVTTMITALVLTRVIYDWLLGGLKLKTIRI